MYDCILYCNILNCIKLKSGKLGVWVGVFNLIICISVFNSFLIDVFLRWCIFNICIICVYIYVDLFIVFICYGIIGVFVFVYCDYICFFVGCVCYFF